MFSLRVTKSLIWGVKCFYAGLAAMALLVVGALHANLSDLNGAPGPGRAATWPEYPLRADFHWAVMTREQTAAALPADDITKRYRYIGWSVVTNEDASATAFIEDLKMDRQYMVHENEQLNDMTIRAIFQEKVVVLHEGREKILRWSFSNPWQQDRTLNADTQGEAPDQKEEDAGNRFGIQKGQYQWVFRRVALEEYYHEMLDNPERLVNLFETFRPVRDEQRHIQGYVIDPVGEEAFLHDIGLQTGDVVRKVNSIRMVSQNRAEYFIAEFLKERLNAVVIEIEREEKPIKLIYMIR